MELNTLEVLAFQGQQQEEAEGRLDIYSIWSSHLVQKARKQSTLPGIGEDLVQDTGKLRVHGRHRGDHSALLAGASPAAALVQSKRSEQDYCPSLEVLGTQQPFIYLTEKHIYQKEGEGRRRHLGSGQKLVDLDPAHSSLSLASEIPPKWHSVDTVWAVTQVTTTIYTRLFKLWEHA